MQRASFASSSEVNRNAASPSLASRGRQQRRGGALDVAGAEADRAIAVDAQLERARASSAGESGTVSRCTLNSSFGVPRTACRLTAPAP